MRNFYQPNDDDLENDQDIGLDDEELEGTEDGLEPDEGEEDEDGDGLGDDVEELTEEEQV